MRPDDDEQPVTREVPGQPEPEPPEPEPPEPEPPEPEQPKPAQPVTPEGDDEATPRAAVTPEVTTARRTLSSSSRRVTAPRRRPRAARRPPPARRPRPALRLRSSPPPVVVQTGGRTGLRLMAAALLVPWLLGYGITGSWAVARGVRGVTQHVPHLDAGYSRPVSPASLVLVGALLLAGFAVLLAAALLLVASSQRRGLWSAVLVLALLLVAGAVWAGVAGHVDPGLWVVLFFGLLVAAVAAAVALVRMPGGGGRARIAEP